MDHLKEQLKRHEGFRSKPYRCSAGKLTIGYGRNLDDVGITSEEGMVLLEKDISRTKFLLQMNAPWITRLEHARADVIINMAFNIGVSRLIGFKRMIAAIERKDWSQAAAEMLDSKWASQVGSRAIELSRQMATGERL